MQLAVSLTGAIPAIAAMWYVDLMDAKRPEPRASLHKVALAGSLSILPVILIGRTLMTWEPPIGSYGYALFHSFLVAGLVEELAKVACVYWVVWRRPEFDERLDGIVYAAYAALGFAMVENVLYLWKFTHSNEEFVRVYLLRALLAVPGHAMWGGMMGYFAAKRRFDHTGPGLLGGFFVAVLLHGMYDAAIFLSGPLAANGHDTVANLLLLVPFVIIMVGAWTLWWMSKQALHADDVAESRAILGRSKPAVPVEGTSHEDNHI